MSSVLVSDLGLREGVLIVNPGARVLEEYRRLQSEIEAERQKLKRLRTARSATMDGVTVELQANIELPQDVKEANEAGAAGIGLFRSEFLFLNRDDLPSEDEQFEFLRSRRCDARPAGHDQDARLGADKASTAPTGR
jgi:phosphotransferase system enzyme I (PtsI)